MRSKLRLTIFSAESKNQSETWRVNNSDLALINGLMEKLDITSIAFRDLGALSDGQRQLVSTAQSLARETGIMLMDEPTSALDLHRQVEVLDFMRRQAQENGTIVLIAVHDLNQALRFADTVLVIANGRIHTCDNPRSLVAVDMFRNVYKIRARVEKCSMNRDRVIVDGPAN